MSCGSWVASQGAPARDQRDEHEQHRAEHQRGVLAQPPPLGAAAPIVVDDLRAGRQPADIQ
jgi:hypothetical protein